MKSDRHLLILLAAAFIATLLPTKCFAQLRPSGIDPNSPAQRDMQAREWALTHIADDVNKHFKKEQFSVFAQVREDFVHIQKSDNEMMQTVFVKKVFENKYIASVSAEINKRARRLRDNLMLPKSSEQAKQEKISANIDEKGIKEKLTELDDSIVAFTSNAVFKNPQVLDAVAARQAGQDLDRIIDLSNQVKSHLQRKP